MRMKTGINYSPKTKYILDKIPANKYLEPLFLEDEYVSVGKVQDEIKEVILNIDFLIYKCEQKLSGHEAKDYSSENTTEGLNLSNIGDNNNIESQLDKDNVIVSFDDYKKLAIKKYYCQQPLSGNQENKLRIFEEDVNGIEGVTEGPLYKRLLGMKSDFENDLGHVGELKAIETNDFNRLVGETATNLVQRREHREKLEEIKEDFKDEYKRNQNIHGNQFIDEVMTTLSRAAEEQHEEGYLEDMFGVLNQTTLGHEDPSGVYINKLYSSNNTLDMYERQKRNLTSMYERSIDDPDSVDKTTEEIAELIQKKDAKINDLVNELGYTASESYAFHTKAKEAENYLEKVGYLILATPFDSFGRNPCCLLKVFLQSITFTIDGEDTNALTHVRETAGKVNYKKENFIEGSGSTSFDVFGKEYTIGQETYSVSDVKLVIDSIRAIISIAHGKDMNAAKSITDALNNLIMSPLKSVLTSVIHTFRDIKGGLINKVTGWFDNFADNLDPNNPREGLSGLADCMSIENLADGVYDIIDEIFDDLEERLIDLYKFIYSYGNFLEEDMLILGKSKWSKGLYDFLTIFSKALDTLDQFSLEEGIEEWINSFLVTNGFGSTYNPKTGQIEKVDLSGCIDPIPYKGKSMSQEPKGNEDLESMDFSVDKEYKKFKDEFGDDGLIFSCDYDAKEAEYIKDAYSNIEDNIIEQSKDMLSKSEN